LDAVLNPLILKDCPGLMVMAYQAGNVMAGGGFNPWQWGFGFSTSRQSLTPVCLKNITIFSATMYLYICNWRTLKDLKKDGMILSVQQTVINSVLSCLTAIPILCNSFLCLTIRTVIGRTGRRRFNY